MSIIAYAKGVLAADSRAIHTTKSNAGHHGLTAYSCDKFKNYDNLFAVVVCGTVMTELGWASLGLILKSKLIGIEVVGDAHQSLLTKQELDSVDHKNRHFIIMTNKAVYCLSADINDDDEGRNGLTKIDLNEHLTYGSGSKMAHVAIVYGHDARKAIEFVVEVEPSCGGEIHSIRQEDLRPMPASLQKKQVKK